MHQILDIVASVKQAAVGGNGLSVHNFCGSYVGDGGESCENTLTV